MNFLDYEIEARRSLWFAQYHTENNGRIVCTIILSICIIVRKKMEDTGSLVILSSPTSIHTLGGYTYVLQDMIKDKLSFWMFHSM